MAINKGTLAKKVDGILEIIYPKTSGDMVMIGNGSTNLNAVLAAKVDVVDGKGLSTNDFTDAYKTKLDSIDATADSAKSVAYAAEAGSVTWNNVQNKPADFPATAHNHTISEITDIGNASVASASAAPWAGITGKPNSFTPATHSHTISEISDIANANVASATSADSVAWAGIAGKPETYTPSTHTHNSNDITSLAASKITGIISIENLPKAAIAEMKKVASQADRFALTTDDVQKGDTVKQLDTGKMYMVVDVTKLNSEDGYEPYTADEASSVPWSGVTGKPAAFTPATHNHTISEITDIADAAVASAESASAVPWTGVTGKPNKFSPSAHTHSISEITDLNEASVASAATADAVAWSAITNKPTSFTPSTHTHTISQISDLANAEVAKAADADTVNGHNVLVDVPASAVFTDHQYTNGTGLELSNGEFSLSAVSKTDGTSTAAPKFGQTFTAIDSVTVNSTGQVTAINTKTVTVPITTITTITLEASKWDQNTKRYTFTNYPANQYRLELLSGESMTKEQYTAIANAKLLGSVNGNYVTALGTIPTIDIPLMVEITQFA